MVNRMEIRKFGPYIGLVQILAIGLLLIISILFIPLVFHMLTQSIDYIGIIIILAIFFVPVFMIVSFVFGDCQAYILDEEGIQSRNLIFRHGKKLFYRDITSIESKVVNYPVGWVSHLDHKISIKHTEGIMEIYLPKSISPSLIRQKDHAEFMKILSNKIGKNKIKLS